MAYEDQEQKRSRVVVDTPNSRREYVSSESSRVPDRSGFSGGTVAAIVVGIVALVTIAFLVVYDRQTTDEASANARLASAEPSSQAPNSGNDATVLTALNKKFEEDAVLSGLALNADVLNGKVLLTGTVISNDQKTRAEQVARKVKGVKYVDNQITVSSS